ncbi:MAG: phosphatidate cytidylyltransferase [Desulfobacterales bacterium]|nr:MAG: phosphatidate cytidylyltransferase [Desulfobacterales bacterium]
MHLKRWITGLVALPFLILLVYRGGILFTLLVTVACILSLGEYYRIVLAPGVKALSNLVALWGYLISLIFLGAAHAQRPDLLLALMALNLLAVAFISLFRFKSDRTVMEAVKNQVQGIVYIPFFLSFLVLIRNDAAGMHWIFWLLCLIFAGDTSAYYVGSYWGRHKLAPAISPGKTVEGALGGLAANLVVGSVFKYYFLPELPWGASILLFLTAGAAGQIGDLFESELKRLSNIKDSGGVLPGHGGILDRIDALLFAGPVAYFLKEYMF